MENLNIKATKHTPEVTFDVDKHFLELKGECYPENITNFTIPIFKLLKVYLQHLEKQTFTVNVEFIYFNSSSSKMLLDLFDILDKEVVNYKKNIVVNWIYNVEDEDAEEYGEEFEEELESLTFNLVSKKYL
ncbi:DUF1987 domain-containing protein [Candidatus Halobeggiatoa sp. HSG11]|nr:DUF1987 domain-containing protein [Candidatus Halobeggiatoa sp. HSG11]